MSWKLLLFQLLHFIFTSTCFTDLPLLDNDVENAEIVYPTVSSNMLSGEEVTLVLLGKWILIFYNDGNLQLHSNLKAEWIHDDHIPPVQAILVECDHKTGVVYGMEMTSRAAISICGSMFSGYFQSKENFYFFQPVDEATGKHVLYKSDVKSDSRKRSPRSAPSFQPDWMFNLTGDTFDILGNESDSDVDLDHHHHSGQGIVNETERKTDNGSTEIPMEYLRGGSSGGYDEENGYFYDSAWSALAVHAHRWSGHNLPTRWLEIAVAVDYTLISFHGRDKVQQYVLSLMNIVSAIYQDPSLGANLKLVISRLLLYEHKKHGVVRSGNAKKSLENVNIWNRKLHALLKPDQPRHDVAVWLTRSDIGGPSGYAPVGGVCDPKRSCSLNRDEGLTSAFIIAHEVAHILGLSHDGDMKSGNNCDEDALDGSVMAPMVAATFSKFSWSACSKKEFQEKVSNWGCLNNPPDEQHEILLNATLQTIFSMDEQCRMEFGDGYSMCSTFDVTEPCSHLWCGHKDNPYVCKTKKGPPLEGTECGFGKWCLNGYCSDVGQTFDKIPIVLNPQHGGWGNWGPWGPCARTCGTGVQYRSRKCDNPKPSYGGKGCEGENEDWRLCNNSPCKEPSDIRAEQCRMLPKVFNMPSETWYPYENKEDDKKCKFSCVNEKQKFVFPTEEDLPDGTPCSYDNMDNICVKGKCYKVGCDGILNSSLTRDSCGVCGGDDSQCLKADSTVKKILKRDISRISVIPKMAQHIKVESVVDTEQPHLGFILKNRRKKGKAGYTITIPNKSLLTKVVEGTKFFYQKQGSNHKLWGTGPIMSETVIMVMASEKDISKGQYINVSTNVQYSIQKDYLLPSKRFVWMLGGWGPCSTSCGGGKRQKTVACWDNQADKLVKKKFCSLLQKPVLDTESCNNFSCDFSWIPGEWEPCSKTCGYLGVQYRELYCVPKSLFDTVENSSAVLVKPWKYMVNPNKCIKKKPDDFRHCNRKPCPVYWQYGNWSECSVRCGVGITSLSAHCPATGDGICLEQAPPPRTQQCLGDLSRNNNKLCKGRRTTKICKRDNSKYCGFELLQRYCKLKGFRNLCCKSCEDFGNYNADHFQDEIKVLTYQNFI
ncbi:hypothetical protein GWI33_004301 [Rhynchophorus ferrugineus]|uniref:Uncharacterized protein n=1 Tax=Rhynchophorus ferrugineus TaxID=354439 RepID=A0A834IXC0_RHYFE|nr:hypothetical protein GWI33_004301 [Rhynchophorus ferrugineus]